MLIPLEYYVSMIYSRKSPGVAAEVENACRAPSSLPRDNRFANCALANATTKRSALRERITLPVRAGTRRLNFVTCANPANIRLRWPNGTGSANAELQTAPGAFYVAEVHGSTPMADRPTDCCLRRPMSDGGRIILISSVISVDFDVRFLRG